MFKTDAEIEADMQALVNDQWPPVRREKAARVGGAMLYELNSFLFSIKAMKLSKIAERDAAVMVETGIAAPVISLTDAIAEKWDEIKVYRDMLSDTGGYQVGTKWFHSDQFSRSQQMGLILLGANIPANTQWKTMDGSFITMTQTLAGQILASAATFDIAVFTVAETHKAAMMASADPSTYDYSTGWPAVFVAV